MKKVFWKRILIVLGGVAAFTIPAIITPFILMAFRGEQPSWADKDCQYVIGDGYAMGTDPEPIVIPGSCDGTPIPQEELLQPLSHYKGNSWR